MFNDGFVELPLELEEYRPTMSNVYLKIEFEVGNRPSSKRLPLLQQLMLSYEIERIRKGILSTFLISFTIATQIDEDSDVYLVSFSSL